MRCTRAPSSSFPVSGREDRRLDVSGSASKRRQNRAWIPLRSEKRCASPGARDGHVKQTSAAGEVVVQRVHAQDEPIPWRWSINDDHHVKLPPLCFVKAHQQSAAIVRVASEQLLPHELLGREIGRAGVGARVDEQAREPGAEGLSRAMRRAQVEEFANPPERDPGRSWMAVIAASTSSFTRPSWGTPACTRAAS